MEITVDIVHMVAGCCMMSREASADSGRARRRQGMSKIKKPMDAAQRERIAAGLRRDAALRMSGYRERALSIYPHVCASCGREFSGIRLKELTVHHKDHNHDNNPPDGSNWELLCVYCHDHEHEKDKMAGFGGGSGISLKTGASTLFNPFAQLEPGTLTDQTPHDRPE